jgi:hypothetical protein
VGSYLARVHEFFHVKKLSSQLTKHQWFYSDAHSFLRYCKERHLRSSSTGKAGKAPYDLYYVGATLKPTKKIKKFVSNDYSKEEREITYKCLFHNY